MEVKSIQLPSEFSLSEIIRLYKLLSSCQDPNRGLHTINSESILNLLVLTNKYIGKLLVLTYLLNEELK